MAGTLIQQSFLLQGGLRCTQLNCGRADSRKHHLIRYFKARKFLSQTGLVVSQEAMVDHVLGVGWNVNCECGLEFDNVEQYNKHLVSCRVMTAESERQGAPPDPGCIKGTEFYHKGTLE